MVNGELGTSDPPLGSSFNSESSQLSMFLVRGIHCQQHIGGASGDLCRVISVYDFSYLCSAAPGAHTILGLHINLAWLVRALGKSVELKSPQVRNSSPFYSSVLFIPYYCRVFIYDTRDKWQVPGWCSVGCIITINGAPSLPHHSVTHTA